ncbi:DUF2514 family protein [Metapseudomonas otitidis]|uniref:DUF2514 family protein n=1 Tax=Metapseudomonas otitidis TaxID=319939 RepID=UPI00244716F6|nr:DUF2514 family protein [Pseudomonas otitidis]MDH0335207.1 DUF2514 domain-containing protein [Pseudomonas otitidis]
MSWARLVPSWAWWALVLALVAGVQQVRVWSADNRAASAIAAEADYRAEVAERDSRAQAAARAEEKRRQAAVEEVEQNAKIAQESADADAARSRDALQRLQQRYDESERRGRACGNSVTAQLGQTAEAEARMRADVLARLGEAARFYADEADRRGIAGRACVEAYERVGGNLGE